jgi:hypothetical protein
MKAVYSSMQLPASAANAAYALSDAVEPIKGFTGISSLRALSESTGDESDSLGFLLATDPTAAANIEWVLYVNLAWLVQLQQQQLSRALTGNSSSSSSSTGQQQRVLPWHVQFLAAVGAPAYRAGWCPVANVGQAMLNQLRAIMYTGQMLQMTAGLVRPTTASRGQGSSSTGAAGLRDHSSSSSSSSSSGGELHQLLPAHETLLLLLLLLLLLEVILLDPGSSAVTIKYCHQRMQDIWSRMQPDSANARETADTMLQPVLHLLGPGVLQQIEAASSSSSSTGSSSSSVDAILCNGWDTLLGGNLDIARQLAKLAKWLVAAGTASLCSQESRVFAESA